ncbi:MAG: hypothetical protein K2O21_03500 [Malacoplasma sp.]|nr:hypothetical protein [Malacoplasma sp.]MDE7075678.1 hypothetical protein [Malacoplasma sp.]
MTFTYVTKKEYSDLKVSLIELIKLVQNEFRNDYFTFQFNFIGSAKYNMITIGNPNKGFDFDVNFEIQKIKRKDLSAQKIKELVLKKFNELVTKNKINFSYPENNSRSMTIKEKDTQKSKILYGVDIAIIWNDEIIFHNKKQSTLEWQELRKNNEMLGNITEIKKKGKWNKFREIYLQKKNDYINKDKESCSLFIESINEIMQEINKTMTTNK